jgi:2,4-diketo-3-deoxy-L-fuconate hydrolase
MKFLRWGPKGAERPGVLDADGGIRDLSEIVPDLGPDIFAPAVFDRLRGLDPASLPAAADASPRIGSCVSHTPNFFCIGLNYSKHAEESGMPRPAEPVLFSKASSALSGPNDPITLPPGANKGDWEVELGVVIGREASYIKESAALNHVAGYCLINDVSERAYQLEGTGQWIKGKSAPGFGPTGPWLVTTDEIADPQTLDLWLDLNGERKQAGDTSDMIFSVAEIIAYMSRHMLLQPGDIIATGTPHGVGMGLKPQRFLRPGDVVELGIDGLGTQRQQVVAHGS